MTDVIRSSNESAIVDQLMHAPFTTAAMRRQAAETIARLMVERDDAKADYARVHRDYMNYRYGGSPPGTPPGRLADETPTHETFHVDPTGKTREPPHCPSCNCGTETPRDSNAASWQSAAETITDVKNAEIKRLQDLLMTRSSVPVEEICTPPAQKASEQRIGPTDPDNDMVICPHCTSQFVAIPVNVQKLLAAPEALPCECTTYCLHSGYPDAPLRRGVFCREKANAQEVVSERRCVCGLAVIPGELRVEIGSTTTTHRLAGPCFQTPAQGK